MPFKAQKQLFEKLEQIAGIGNLTKEERLEYDEALKVYRDCKNIVDYAKDEGHAEGKVEGLAEGREWKVVPRGCSKGCVLWLQT